MIREIEAKTILIPVKDPNAWFGVRYTMNIYRGCEHQCIYCDSRSACYGIEDFRDVLVKANALQLLEAEMMRKRKKGTIGTGSMSDPYTPAERRYNLTGRALEVIARHGFPVHITTKSDLVVRDLATLREVNRTWVSVSFTVTTADDELARKLEPGAPPPSARLAAMRTLAQAGIYTGVTMMPILPFIEDNVENIRAIMERAREAGARYVIPWLGMSLRDRQRDHYYRELDQLFPGLRRKYEARFGERYSCAACRATELADLVHELGTRFGLTTRMADLARWAPPNQPALL